MSGKPRFKTVETETSWDVIDVINGGRYGSWRNFCDAEQDRLTREADHQAKIAKETSLSEGKTMSETAKIIRMHPLPWEHQTHELSEGYSTIIYDANGKRPILDHLREDEAAAISNAVNSHAALVEAVEDLLSGWKYIREHHGDLYGVGWDRAQEKAEAALRLAEGASDT